MAKIILASSSTYRRSLLNRLKLEFSCVSPDIDERPLTGETADQLVKRLSLAKARKAGLSFPDALIIGSDQVVMQASNMLGKPGTVENAVQQLTLASGKTITLLTGVCLYNSSNDNFQLDAIHYEVTLRDLSAAQIERYVLKDQPLDCAGSFKWESLGIALFKQMRGEDVTSLEGLPLIRLTSMLEKEGVHVL
jgi:MAF protein